MIAVPASLERHPISYATAASAGCSDASSGCLPFTAIKAGASWEVARQIALWAIPGAIVQFLGGPKRQLGILFATGLLIFNINAGWAVLVGVALRWLWTQWTKGERRSEMEVFAAGVIAGDALYSFYDTTMKAYGPKK